MLMIEDRELTDDDLRAIAAVSPGCRINIVQGGQVTSKMELRLPDRISGIPQMACPNKGCITRAEHQESVAPIMHRIGEDRVRCHYCDQVMPSADMF